MGAYRHASKAVFAAGASSHPISAQATGEVVGQVIEGLAGATEAPEIAFLFATPGHGGALEDAGEVVRRLLEPKVLLGATSALVFGPGCPPGDGAGLPGSGRGHHPPRTGDLPAPCLALWVGQTAPALGLRLPPGAGLADAAMPETRRLGHRGTHQLPPSAMAKSPQVKSPQRRTLVLLGVGGPDALPPFESFSGDAGRGVEVVGGVCAPAQAQRNVLLLDDQAYTDGAIGVIFGPADAALFGPADGAGKPTERAVGSVRSFQAWRPLGRRYRVTRSERNVVYRLDGVEALQQLREVASDRIPAQEAYLIDESLHLAISSDSGAGGGEEQWELREVLGADPVSGALALRGQPEILPGATAMFAVRQTRSHDPLSQLLSAQGSTTPAPGALVFESLDPGDGQRVDRDGQRLGRPEAPAPAGASWPAPAGASWPAVAGIGVVSSLSPLARAGLSSIPPTTIAFFEN